VSETVDHILDLLRPWALCGAKRMFGGWGLYRGGVMFGIVADDQLYLKVDDGNAADYERDALEPFRYTRAGRTVALSYRAVPDRLLESEEALHDWSRKAWEAALRAASRERRVRVRER
jgi:DNA transformation protein and related proteins